MASSGVMPNGVLWLAHGVPTQWAFHGMAVGLLMRCDSMDSFYGKLRGDAQGSSMGSPWGSHPMGIPWSGIGASHWGFHGKLLWLAHGVPTQWAFHGMALVRLIGDSMASFYGQLMGFPPNGHSMEWHWECS